MARYIPQDHVIERLNHYFRCNNIDVEANKTGICNGLAMVYAKYVVDKKEQRFFDILELIGQENFEQFAHWKRLKKISDYELDRFVAEVLLSFAPHDYGFGLINQANAIQVLQTDEGKSLESCFSFAMVSSLDSWEGMLQELALQEGEILTLGSGNHACALHYCGGKYIIYNPNYPEGTQSVPSLKEALQLLHNEVFAQDSEMLGMSLHLVRDPNKEKRPFPRVLDLYDRYLSNVHDKTVKKSITTLELVARDLDNAEIAQHLIARMGAKAFNAVKFKAANLAVKNNNVQVLSTLDKTLSDNERIEIMAYALTNGREESYNALMKNKPISIYSLKNAKTLLRFAGIGGNRKLLEQIYAQLIKVLKTGTEAKALQMRTEVKEEDVLRYLAVEAFDEAFFRAVIKSGSSDCLSYAWDCLSSSLNQEALNAFKAQRLSYLAQSIRLNKASVAMVILMHEPLLSREELGQIHLDTTAITRLNVPLALALQQQGIGLSTQAQHLLQTRQKKGLTFFQQAGVAFVRFTDFIKEMLYKKNGVFLEEPTRSSNTESVQRPNVSK